MMAEGLTFKSPQEELAYLRSKVLETEQKLERFGGSDRESIVRETLSQFKSDAGREINQPVVEQHVAELTVNNREVKLEEMIKLSESKGILYSLSVTEKIKNWKLEDDFHDYLVTLVNQGLPLKGIKDGDPLYKAMHMVLYEVVLPKLQGEKERPLSELLKGMEQLYAGLLSVSQMGKSDVNYLAFEIANPDGVEETRAFVSVPKGYESVFERQMLSIFPNSQLLLREHDYNIFNESGVSLGATAKLSSHSAYPLKTYEGLGEDPLNVILSGFSKLPRDGAGAALQIIFKPAGTSYVDKYKRAVTELEKGKPVKEVLKDDSFSTEFKSALSYLIAGEKKKDEKEKTIDTHAIESVKEKLLSPVVAANIRLAVSSSTEAEAKHYLAGLEASFHQFENAGKNSIQWENVRANKESDFYRAFTFRLFRENETLPLNLSELSSILHFHSESLIENTSLKQKLSRSAPAPTNAPNDGTLMGTNDYQGLEKKIFMAPEDRLRHLYVIGQTGTGKTTLLKNMIVEDMRAGKGVCLIDPHGSDVLDVLGQVPKERMDDVIYFDPAFVERPMALNMLEYDRRYPEQKTFVVNEMLSIFNKLFDMKTAGGPMFEQYFRNAVLLTIDDPETGSTLVDVSRVLSNKQFRELKLSRCTNPLVIQFWREVAEKAGGEASLANIVPYITSKFDNFLSNDIMRPVIGQEHSTFNFREVMDSKKILLVNLSKGRLGELNANLIGLILVGKILMAALSRVDATGELPPFYLYIDEFQNVTTDSIASILSEARKYGLSLTIAHQFISQIDEQIRNAVFGNVGSMAIFRVGAEDAEFLEKQLAPTFTAKDIMNIDNFNAYLKLLVHGVPVPPFNIRLVKPEKGDTSYANSLRQLSIEKYGGDRAEIEKLIMEKYKKPDATTVAPGL